MGEEGEFVGQEVVRQVELVLDSRVHVGAALTTVDGGDPGVARTLVMEMEHRTNQSKADPVTTMFGFSQDAAAQVCGGLLAAIHIAYGHEAVDDLLMRVAQYVQEQIAIQEGTENDDR
jgi:hypothetical protein